MFQVNDLVRVSPTVRSLLGTEFWDFLIGKVGKVTKVYGSGFLSVQFGYRDERRFTFVEEELVSAV